MAKAIKINGSSYIFVDDFKGIRLCASRWSISFKWQALSRVVANKIKYTNNISNLYCWLQFSFQPVFMMKIARFDNGIRLKQRINKTTKLERNRVIFFSHGICRRSIVFPQEDASVKEEKVQNWWHSVKKI